jgi:hypothetical protein
MVEFLVAMPASLRFGKEGVTKWFMRKIVERHVGPKVAWRSKHGFSAPLWFTSGIQEKLNFQETLRHSPLLEELPFSQQFLTAPFHPPFHKLRWAIFALTKVYMNLKSRTYE